jgi:predicted RNase H-like HicB family nuclease
MARSFTAVIHFDAESQVYVGFIPALPGTHSCGDTLDELRTNLKEAVELMLEVLGGDGPPLANTEIMLETIEVAA